MTIGHLLGIIVPVVSALFSLTFCVLWYRRKTMPYLLFVGISFGLIATGFTLKQYLLAREPALNILLVSTCYMSAICLLIAAAGQRRGVKGQGVFLTCLASAAIISTVVSSVLETDLSVRSILHNCIIGAVFLIGSFPLSKTKNPDILDRILLWVFTLIGVTFGLIVLSIRGASSGLTEANYYTSTYWFLTNISLVVWLVSLALILFAMTATDLMKKIRHAAEEDHLSGLLIRSAFTREVTALMDGTKINCGVILFDLDHFKQINDTYGHTAGDAVLERIGALVHDFTPANSICGRLGGEEFGIVLPGMPLAATRLFAEELRMAIMMLEIDGIPSHQRISASFGITLHDPQQPFEAAYKDADTALYEAKKSGRNKVSQLLKGVA